MIQISRVVRVLFFFPVCLCAQERWNLEKCITYAHDNNIRIKQAEIDSRMAENRLKQSRYELFPDFYLSGSERLSYGKTVVPITNQLAERRVRSSGFSANSSIDLFRGFQNINSIRKNNLDYLASKYDIDKIRNDISLSVTNAYLLILFNLEALENASEQLRITGLQLNRTKKLVESGSVARGDLLELEAQLADEELELVRSENQVNLSYLNLLQLLQLDGDFDLEIVVPILDSMDLAMETTSPSEIFTISLGIMPEIKSAELKLESSMKNISISRSNRSPYLTFGGTLGTGYTESSPRTYSQQLNDNIFRNFALSLNIPIFSKYSAQQSINLARLQSERANYNLLLEKNELRKNIENAHADAQASLKSYQANKKSLQALTESFKYAEKRFDAGLINSVDYNSNKNSLRQAQSDLNKSKYEYIFKRKILDFFQGKPIKF